MRNIFFFLLPILILSCSKPEKKEDHKPQIPDSPDIMKPGKQKNDMTTDGVLVMGKKIGKTDPLSCDNICNHLAYCNEKSGGKASHSSRLRICIKSCDHDKTPTGKAKFDAFRNCIDKNRESPCSVLRQCLNDELIKAKTLLQGKDSIKK
ncbi:hypothetical protein KKF34_00830 [Myxococcota bacterium]|nr:hypothetical protein [Myxococcota bacterium]MBU1381973.1 hypothetical protein [Myxococcota bacterium]MBU1495405.1 hypothetical protein [Myxococcota bacterium]